MDDTASSVDLTEADCRIRQRLDACRQGMRQLDVLRNKHQRLMKDMRVRLGLTATPKDIDGDANISSDGSPERTALVEQNDSLLRCMSPAPSTADLSSSISHRSSLSMDSGCVSIVSELLNNTHMPMSYSAYRKLSMEERRKQMMSEDEGCVVDDSRPLLDTAIESTTALRGTRYVAGNWLPPTRPKSVCHFYPEENTVTVDCLPAPTSFTQSPRLPRRYISRAESVITRRPQMATKGLFAPPPANISPTTPRKPQKPETAGDGGGPVFRACCVYVNPSNSPPAMRPRPRSLALSSATSADWNEFHRFLQEDGGFESRDRFERQSGGRVSRQQSCASSASHHTLTPTEVRKFHVVKSSSSSSSTVGSVFVSRRCPDGHASLSRSNSSQSTDSATSSATNNTSNNRFKREKDWHESEGL